MLSYNEKVGQRLKNARLSKGYTLEELGEKVGLTKSTVTKYERGEIKTLDISKIKDFANILKIDTAYLAGWEDEPDDNNDTKIFTPKKKAVKIPVLGTVSAGIPLEAITDIIDWEEISEEMASKGEHFCLEIKGDSMLPRFVSGDVIVVRKQDDVDSGDIAVVLVNGGDATVKKVVKSETGIMLIASNQSVFEPRFYSNLEIEELPVTILGKVVELRAKF